MEPVLTLSLLLAFLLSLALTYVARRALVGRAMMDTPNERSMHAAPVPRGGGLAVVGAILLSVGVATLGDGLIPLPWAFWAGILMLIIVSWMDDCKGLSAGTRFIVQILAVLVGGFAFDSETLLGDTVPFWLDRAVLLLLWAWFLNLYNFMDGIDGLTCMETICIAAGIGLVIALFVPQNAWMLPLVGALIGACGGFLVFNWHPAKIFLGDVGSVPLGYAIGFLLLKFTVQGTVAIENLRALWPAALILPLYYLADSGLTLSKRILRGEKFWQAHRQHFYQRAAQGVGRHDYVVLWILAANVCLVGAAALGVLHPWPGIGLGVAVVAYLLRKMHKSALTSV